MADVTATIENVHIPLHSSWRNFQGAPGTYNASGERSFCIFINPDAAENLLRDGWDVRQLDPREEGDPCSYFMRVKIKYVKRDGSAVRFPPKVVMIASGKQTYLDEETIGVLDGLQFENVDVKVAQSEWETKTGSGVATYLRSLYVTVVEDDLDRKYSHIPRRDTEA